MKLFDGYEAVLLSQENKILITHNGYLYFICDRESKRWSKYRNAGNNRIAVENYDDINREELIDLCDGVFPENKTVFLKLCNKGSMNVEEILDILERDYPSIMNDKDICMCINEFLYHSDIVYKSYERLTELLNSVKEIGCSNKIILKKIKELSFEIIGKDIYKKEIEIMDGHDYSSYFYIMPARIIDWSDTNGIDNVSEKKDNEISIEELDVDDYLTPFLFNYFDGNMKANAKRVVDYWEEDDGSKHYEYTHGFEWYLTHNYYSYNAFEKLLEDMKDTCEALLSNKENEYTKQLRLNGCFLSEKLKYSLSNDELEVLYHKGKITDDKKTVEMIVDFYNRFIYRMEYMVRIGKEKGYDLISVMGP